MAFSLAEAFVELRTRGLKTVGRDFNKATSQLRTFSGDLSRVGDGLSAFGVRGGQSIGQLTRAVALLGSSLPTLGIGFAAAGGVAAAALGVKGVKAAGDLQESMKEVATISDEVNANMEGLTNQIQALAIEANVDASLLAPGLYQTISAGIGDASEAMRFLEVAAKAATAGITDVTTSVDGLSSVVNAFGFEVNEVDKIADLFFKTVERGKLTFGDIARSIGNVGPLAAQLGVSLEDLLASGAALTLTGQSLSEAFTGLRGIMVALTAPADGTVTAAKEMGIEFNAAALRAQGLTGFLSGLKDATGGSASEMAKLFGRVEALNAAMSLTGNQAAVTKSILEDFTTSAGAMTTAFERTQDAFNAQTRLFRTQLSEVLRDLGQEILPSLTTGFEKLNEAIKKLNVSQFVTDFGKFLTIARDLAKLQVFGAVPSIAKGIVDDLREERKSITALMESLTPNAPFEGASMGNVNTVDFATSRLAGMPPIEDVAAFEAAAAAFRDGEPLRKAISGQVRGAFKDALKNIELPTNAPRGAFTTGGLLTFDPTQAEVLQKQADAALRTVETLLERFDDFQRQSPFASTADQLAFLNQEMEVSKVQIDVGTEAWRRLQDTVNPLLQEQRGDIQRNNAEFTKLIKSVADAGPADFATAFGKMGKAVTAFIDKSVKGFNELSTKRRRLLDQIRDLEIGNQATRLSLAGKELQARLVLFDREQDRARTRFEQEISGFRDAEERKTEFLKQQLDARLVEIRSFLKQQGILTAPKVGALPTVAESNQPIITDEQTQRSLARFVRELGFEGRRLTGSFKGLSEAVEGFRAAGIEGALAGFFASLVSNTEGFENLSQSWNRLFDQMAQAISPAVDAVAQSLTPAFEGLATTLEGLEPVFKATGFALKGLGLPIQATGFILEGIGKGLKAVFGGIIGGAPGRGDEQIAAMRGEEINVVREQRGEAQRRRDAEMDERRGRELRRGEIAEQQEAQRPDQGQAIQIANITGPTRSLLVDLLSPLRTLTTIFPAMLDELRMIRGILTTQVAIPEFGAIPMGGQVQIPDLRQPENRIDEERAIEHLGDIHVNIQQIQDIDIEQIDQELQQRLRTERRVRGRRKRIARVS